MKSTTDGAADPIFFRNFRVKLEHELATMPEIFPLEPRDAWVERKTLRLLDGIPVLWQGFDEATKREAEIPWKPPLAASEMETSRLQSDVYCQEFDNEISAASRGVAKLNRYPTGFGYPRD
ncbi:hypothetical protein KM043_012713 [Ampulex compressa]|nr:hypothetical protein KM043_012713 [Ampulex compressa]